MNYIQYNNTLIVANSSTSFVPNATSIYGTYTPSASGVVPNLPGVPTTLVEGFPGVIVNELDYAATAIDPGTDVNIGGQTFPSPTAWVADMGAVGVFWTQYSDGMSKDNGVQFADSTFVGSIDPGASAYAVMEAHPTFSGSILTDLPSAWKSVWVSAIVTVPIGPGSTISLSSCTGSWAMSGEPTAHIPVNALTITNAKTQTINGNFGSSTLAIPIVASSPIIQSSQTSLEGPTSQAPEPTQSPVIQSSQTSLFAPTTQAPSPTPAPVVQATQPSLDTPAPQSPAPQSGDSQNPHGVQKPTPSGAPADVSAGSQAGDYPPGTATGGASGTAAQVTGNGGNQVQPNAQPEIAGTSLQITAHSHAPGQGSSPTPGPVISLSSSVFMQDGHSNFVVGSQTLAPGGAAITVGTTVLSLATSASAVVVDGHSSQLASVIASPSTIGEDTDPLVHYILSAIGGSSGKAIPPSAVITLGSSTYTRDSNSNIVIGTQTLVPGGAPITAGGTVLSLGPSASAVVINGRTSILADTDTAAAPPAAITVGSSIIAEDSASQFVIGSQTLVPGGAAIVVGSQTLSFASSTSAIVVNGQTLAITTPAPNHPVPVITIGSTVYSENSASQFVIGSQTLIPGAAAITVGSQTLSLASSGSAVVVDGKTLVISTPSSGPSAPVITIGSAIYTENSASQFVIGSQTLVPGGEAITVGTETVSLDSSVGSIVVNGQTFSIATPTSTGTGEPVITLGSSVFAEISASEFIIGTQTLYAGGSAITVDGTILSLAPSGSTIVLNGQSSVIETQSGTQVPVAVATGAAAGFRATMVILNPWALGLMWSWTILWPGMI